MKAINPSFLKESPQIFGMELKDILLLSVLISILAAMNLEGITILIWTSLALMLMLGRRKLFQKKYFEFILSRRRFSLLYIGARAGKGRKL